MFALSPLLSRFGTKRNPATNHRRRLLFDVLEDRSVPATVSISDATMHEAADLNVFVPANTAILLDGADLAFGPDRNGDSAADLYVVGRNSDNVVVYDGQSGSFIEEFVSSSSGLDGAAFLAFGPDGAMLISTVTSTGTRDSVLKVDQATKTVTTFISNNPAENGGLAGAKSMTFGPDGALYIVSARTHEVLRYDPVSGAFIDAFVTAGSGGVSSPATALFGSDRNGDDVPDLYVSSNLTNEVLLYSGADGAPLGVFVTANSGGLAGPHDMEFGADGHLYVVSSASSNERVFRFDGTTGAFIDIIIPEGLVPETSFITFNDAGELFVTSERASEVIRYSAGPIVSLSAASEEEITIDFSTADGTAAGGADYAALAGRLRFSPGQTSKRILLTVSDDGVLEGDESFTVNLSDAVGATVADSSGLVTIVDGDARVNTTTAGVQVTTTLPTNYNPLTTHQAVASDNAGNVVVVWSGNGTGDADGIFFQRYDANGVALGGETRANVATAGSQANPVVGRAANNGKYVVAWNSNNGVYARVFNADGSPAGNDITVASGSSSTRNYVDSIAVDADGDFVVLYKQLVTKGFSESRYWQFQRYNAAGQAQGNSTRVTTLNLINGQAGIASDANGNFVVVWDDGGINAQRYNSSGKKVGSVISVSSGVSGELHWQSNVGRDADGDFVVTWVTRRHDAANNLTFHRLVQVLNTDGAKRGSAIELGQVSLEYPMSLAVEPGGDFILSWTEKTAATATDVYVQRFDLNGVAKDAASRVNQRATGNQEHSSVAVAGNGNFVVVWNAPTYLSGPDLLDSDIRARRYEADALALALAEGGSSDTQSLDAAFASIDLMSALEELEDD
jgi:hypothetical protein